MAINREQIEKELSLLMKSQTLLLWALQTQATLTQDSERLDICITRVQDDLARIKTLRGHFV